MNIESDEKCNKNLSITLATFLDTVLTITFKLKTVAFFNIGPIL